MTTMLSAHQSARVIGMCCWMEQQVFALLGAWTTAVSEPGPRLVMLELSDHAAWRAQRWYELLPTAPPGADALVAGTDALAALLTGVHDLPGDGHTIDRLVVAESLLELLDRSVAELADRTTELAGAAVLRIAAIIRTDLAVDLDRCRSAIRALDLPPDLDIVAGFTTLLHPFGACSALEFLDRT
jgi:hypothetical protein